MSDPAVAIFATDIATELGNAVGRPVAFVAELLEDAAVELDTQLQGGPAVTRATWAAATAKWTNAQRTLGPHAPDRPAALSHRRGIERRSGRGNRAWRQTRG